eukprot:m.212233 g.212233  ORF g.212233 m.212233 type:complete len:70 (-) comp15073_c0_seq1:130-339(-)
MHKNTTKEAESYTLIKYRTHSVHIAHTHMFQQRASTLKPPCECSVVNSTHQQSSKFVVCCLHEEKIEKI